MSDAARARYSEYYDAEGRLIVPEGKQPVFGTIRVDLGDGDIGVVTDAQEAAYYTAEFDIRDTPDTL